MAEEKMILMAFEGPTSYFLFQLFLRRAANINMLNVSTESFIDTG